MERFSRIELLVGKEKLKRIQHAHVSVVGLGAVGSFAVEALARAGVGRLSLADFDVVRPSNINRNLLALSSTVSQNKVSVCAARIKDINPLCRVEERRAFVDKETVEDIIKDRPDVLVDAIDSIGPKLDLLIACVKNGVRVISSMGAALKTDPCFIRYADISLTSGCRLAAEVRKGLRKAGIKSGIPCVYSLQPRKRCLGQYDTEEEYFERGRKRHTLGSLPTVTGIFGLYLAHYSLELLCCVPGKASGDK